MLWDQSLKIIYYITLLIFQNKTRTEFKVKTWGGIKDMLSPHVKNRGDTSPQPSGIYALDLGAATRPYGIAYRLWAQSPL